ncbi:MAG: calcium-binding protein [Rhodobacter sp.]|nr:calcium-binding protein [Rhodobacter sp.]
MLAALLLLGLLPLAAMPMMQVETGSLDTVDDDSADQNGIAKAGGDLLEAPGTGAPDTPGKIHTLDATPGETVFDGFAPGADVIRVDLSGMRDELVFEETSDAGGAAVSFSVGQESAVTLRFPGLDAVPGGDIGLTLAEAGNETIQMTFEEVRSAAEAEEGLDPVDPDQPDPDPPGDGGPGLDPVDPDQPDQPAGDGGDDPGLDPNEEVFGPEGGLSLRGLIERDSGAVHGLGAALDAAFADGTEDAMLGGGDDTLSLADDGQPGTGTGSIGLVEGTPVIDHGTGIAVVDGGAGDDSLTAGDGAAFVFGGEGADTLTAGDGAAALFGGEGADQLAGAAAGGLLDGGLGDDTVTGGPGGDTIEGGEHATDLAGDDSLTGGAGDDLIRGGYGSDTLTGGDGNDLIDHLGRVEERVIEEHREFAWHLDGDADSLSGGAGDDTLIMDDDDVAEGGAGQDLFWVYGDGAGAAEILDFRVGDDFLRLTLNPHILPTGSPEVMVEPSPDGADALVSVNGDLVAVLRGAPGATASDVYAEVVADVFPAGS